VVFTLVADGAGIRPDPNFDQLLARFLDEADVGHDAQHVTDLVGQIFQQFAGIAHAYGFTPVVATDDQFASLRIREAADPAEVVVTP